MAHQTYFSSNTLSFYRFVSHAFYLNALQIREYRYWAYSHWPTCVLRAICFSSNSFILTAVLIAKKLLWPKSRCSFWDIMLMISLFDDSYS